MEAKSSKLISRDSTKVTPLRVLFDGRKLGDGGIGVYIENTICGLLQGGTVTLSVIATREQADQVAWRRDVEWIYDTTKPYSLSEYLLLARRIDFSRYDLFHSPHYTLPFGVSIPSVVTIHDLIHIEHPERVYYPIVARNLIRSAVKRATAVLVVSQATKRALTTLMPLHTARIQVVPNAIPSAFEGQSASSTSDDWISRIVSGGPYFVAVLSNLKPHKGIAELIDAYSQLRERLSASLNHVCPRLLLVGYGAAELAKRSDRLAQAARSSGIEILGTLSPERLHSVYASAKALVVASRAEGFCLPALEAQSAGLQVVCTPIPALLELVTEQDIVATGFSSDALAQALHQVVLDPVAEKRVDIQHLERFTRVCTAAQISQLYYEIAAPQGVHISGEAA